MKTSRFLSALALSAGLAFPGLANAYDPTGNAVADALLAGMEAAGSENVAVGSVKEDGSSVIIDNLTADSDKRGRKASVRIDSITFENARVTGDGGIESSNVEFSGLTLGVDNGSEVTAQSGSIADLTMQSADKIKAGNVPGDGSTYSTLELRDIVAGKSDDGKVEIARVVLEQKDLIEGVPTRGSLMVEGAVMDPETIDDPKTRARLTELGYDKLEFSARASGKWDPETERGILETFTLTGQEMGTLSLSAAFGGFTPEVLATLRQAKIEKPELMGLMQSLSIETLDIRINNDSLVDRLLDQRAKQAGMSRQDLVNRMSTAIPNMLAILQNPPFQEKVAAAVAAFLATPGNLHITAKPVQPVPVGAIVGSAMAAPGAVPTLLNMDITANE